MHRIEFKKCIPTNNWFFSKIIEEIEDISKIQLLSINHIKFEGQKFYVNNVETLKITNFRYYFHSQCDYNLNTRKICNKIFIHILIYLKILKITLSSMKFNTKNLKNKSQKKSMPNTEIQIIILYGKLEFIGIKNL